MTTTELGFILGIVWLVLISMGIYIMVTIHKEL